MGGEDEICFRAEKGLLRSFQRSISFIAAPSEEFVPAVDTADIAASVAHTHWIEQAADNRAVVAGSPAHRTGTAAPALFVLAAGSKAFVAAGNRAAVVADSVR